MANPSFPNPARRAKILHAFQLRQQGRTLRQIAQEMDCAHSTVAAYLRDYELFRNDLIHELAADQIVSHAIHLAQLDSEQHDQRLAAIRELRLLLTAIPEIRRAENDRIQELVSGAVNVDRYGNRHITPDRAFLPTEQEQQQILAEPPAEPQPGPDHILYCPPLPEPAPESNQAETPTESNNAEQTEQQSNPGSAAEQTPPHPDPTDQTRTKSNKIEQQSTPNPALNGTSDNPNQNSPDQPELEPDLAEFAALLKHIQRQQLAFRSSKGAAA